MRSLLFIVGMVVVLSSTLFAKSCADYEASYDLAQYTIKEKGMISYRKSYDLVNDLIDSATSYLGYCSQNITLAEQYQIQQVIKRADKKRRDYFNGAVREYHALYGIRPNVTEIYQDGNFWGGPGGGTSGYSSPPRFPTVQQPQMPPVQH